MSGVKSLTVRGIRSFGPEDSDEQRISFDKPLTLILGQNGCGKTTIIECLRYAITGQMPPGSRNECFVHDAKVNRSTEVLAQVKLKIVNAKDKQLEVSRSMKVTAMPKKTKFQTLESYLSTVDENGKPKDISSRCADLDFIMHEELGVSKAILNSVIFCHQEDCAWPLDEGKKVKERFDEIFDADKYSDCFERFRKIRKEYANTLNLLAQEVSFLTEKKQDLDKKKLEVINTETRISETELKASEITAELKPIYEKLSAIKTLENNLLSFETQREKIKVRLEHCQTQETELKSAIKDVFEGTKDELQEKITNYEEVHKTKKKELDDSVKKNNTFTKEDDKLTKEKNTNDIKYNKFTLLESQNQEKIDNKFKMILETAKLAEIESITEVNSDEQSNQAVQTVTDKIKSLKQELADQKAEADVEEKKMQTFVDESRDDLSRHKQKISSKETEIHKNKRELTKLEKEINTTNESKTRLEALEQKLNEAETDYTNCEKELNPEECQQEINDDEKVIEKHEHDLEELSAKVTKLQKQSAKLKERDMIEGMMKSKEKELAIMMNKHKVALTEILGSVPEKDFAVNVNKFECDIRAQVDSLKKKLKEKNTESTKLETERKHVREMLTDRRGELTKAEDQMYKACGTATYDATLTKCTSTVEKLQDEQNVLQSSMFIFAKYKTQLKDNSCCPLCSRGFENENEVTDLISQLTTQVMNVPAKLEKVTEDLQKASAKKDELLSMKALNEKIINLKEKEIPKLETRLADTDVKIKACTETIEELQMSLIEPEQKMQTAKQVHGDMPLIDRCQADYKTITKNLDNLKALCADMESDMTLDEGTAKQTDLRVKLSTLRNRVKTSQKKLNLYSKKLQTLGDKKNKIKEELLNVQKKVQDLVNLQETKKQVETDRERLLKELQELQDGLAPLQEALKGKQEAKNETVKKYRGLVEVKNSFIAKVVSSFEKVKAIEQEIKHHQDKNIPGEMEKLKVANEKLLERQKQIATEKETLATAIDALKDEIAKQEIYKRDLKDNMKLRETQIDIEKCQKDETEINEKLNGINRDQLSEKESLVTQQTKLFREKAQAEGSLDELKRSLKTSRNDLKRAMAKDIEKRYKEKVYELYVTKTTDKDIKDYAVALEKCLMEFHKEKMENINLVIRELWRKIYRGNDIDYIEIKTEGSVSTDSDRRKYDYRVVQCKNGVEIDMRGRCSAGQKVLACLIIRLALAETFSARFGILALDEPTTNLDQENVRSLCLALGEIVQERMRQKNFMFIIITHDREFIESLGNIDKVSHFYEVSRNDDGKSRIKRVKFV